MVFHYYHKCFQKTSGKAKWPFRHLALPPAVLSNVNVPPQTARKTSAGFPAEIAR